ncbi:MAG: hypothetical protein JW839_12430 [Candidatus Lokiarchaeota archaeon]|nr:hypothetical protein [Candidatus Lokiarchaeota archaeon]
MSPRKLKHAKAVVISAIVAGASLAVVLGFLFLPGGGPQGKPFNLMISEIRYTSDSGIVLNDQFVEAYSFTNFSTSSLKGWYIETRDRNGDPLVPKTAIPEVAGFGEFWHICIRGDAGATSINTTDLSAVVHLNIETNLLDEQSGHVFLYYDNGTQYLVDYVCYGGLAAPLAVAGWSNSDGGASTSNASDSVSIWGWDGDHSMNWYNDTPTPASFNNLHNVVDDPAGNGSVPDVSEVIYNGFLDHYPTYVGAQSPNPVPIAVTNAHPTPGVSPAEIKEMVEATIRYLAEFGRAGGPKLGNDSVLDIHIGIHPGANSSFGATYEDGSIYIWVGNEIRSADPVRQFRGKVDLKYNVEHEVVHAYQYEQGIIKKGNEPFYEGEATYWGMVSAARNYNLTVQQVNTLIGQIVNSNGIPGQSWDHHGKSLNTATFGNGTVNGTTRFGFTHGDYCNGFLLLKFINETFGEGVLKNLTNSMSGSVGFREAAEAATGLSFAELLRRYYQWRADGSAEDNNGVPGVTPDESMPLGDAVYSSTESVAPYGAAVEDFIMVGSAPLEIWVTPQPGQSVSVTVIVERTDGSTETYHHTVSNKPGSTQAPIPIDPSKVASVRLVKMNLNDTAACNVSVEFKPAASMFNRPTNPPNEPDHFRAPGVPLFPYNERCTTDGLTGTAFDGYRCQISGLITETGPFNVSMDVITYEDTDLDAFTPDWVIFLHKYNALTHEPLGPPSGPFVPDPSVPIIVDVQPGDVAGGGCYVVAEIQDASVGHVMAFFVFVFDYAPF